MRDHFEGRLAHLEGLLSVQASESSDHVVKRALADAYAAGAIGGASTSNEPGTSSHNNNFDASSSYYFKDSESPEPSQQSGLEDETAGAAFALEVLAGGDQPSTLINDEKGILNHNSIPVQLISLEEFAKNSVLAQESNSNLEGNSRIPLLGFLNRRNITDTILACLQTR